jgi:hypothetical protein
MKTGNREMIKTQIIAPFLWACLLIGITVIGAVLALDAWDSFTGKLEIRRLEAQAAAESARAGRVAAEAALEREAGEHALKEGQADAIRAPAEAAARAVDRQSVTLMYYGMLTPLGIVGLALALMAAGAAGGAVGTGLLMFLVVWPHVEERGKGDSDEQ